MMVADARRASTMAYEVGKVRACYPALADGYAYLDGAAGTQLPESVISAIAGAYRAGMGNAGGAFPASDRAAAITQGCREAVADLLGGEPDGVILGPNMTTLTYRLAAALPDTGQAAARVLLSKPHHAPPLPPRAPPPTP